MSLPHSCGRLHQNSNEDFGFCSAHIELSHVIQAQAGQTTVGSVQVTAATVDVDDPVPVSDRGIFVHSAGEKYCRGVADDADGVRIGAYAVWFYPAPDAGVVVVPWETVNKMEFLIAHRELQGIR